MNKNLSNVIAALMGFLIVAALMPFAYIWAWNTLFESVLRIEYTFWNWLAVCVMTSMLSVRTIRK